MQLKHALRRRYLRLLIWWRNRTKKELEFDNEHQRRLFLFVLRMLRHSGSRPVYTPTSSSYYLENQEEEVYIIIHRKFLSVISKNNKDSALIDDRMYDRLQLHYYSRLRKDKRAFKDRMYAKERQILKHIYESINKPDSPE